MRRFFSVLFLFGALACNDSTTPDLNSNSPDLGTLGVGRVRTLTFAEAENGITIPEHLSAADYLVVVSNIDMSIDGGSDYVVRGDRGAAFEAKLRKYERRTLGAPALRSARLPALRAQRIPGVVQAVAPPNVGDQMTLNVLRDSTPPDPDSVCKYFVPTTGTVRAVSTRAIIVSDNTSPSGGFTTEDYQAIADEFDKVTYPTGVSYFGNPSDIDDNTHVVIYYTPRVNEMTPRGEARTKGYVGGFFFAGDLFARAGCSASNEAEIFYMLAPDPNAVFGNEFQRSLVRQVTRGTVAHEFQHMINSGHRLFRTSAPLESAWLDEALAHFAEDATGRVALGIGDLNLINLNGLSQIGADDQGAFFLQNFTRARYFVESPGTIGPIGSEPGSTTLAARGASWALVRYAADWFSGNSPRTLTRALATGPDTGVANLVKNTKVPLDSLMSRWLVTLYTDHFGISGLPAQYNYRSYDFRAIVGSVPPPGQSSSTGYPLPVTSIGNGTAVIPITVPSSSAAYFLVDRGTEGVSRTIRVTNTVGSAVTDRDGRIYIVRLR